MDFVRPWAFLFKDACLIFGLGLLALVAFFEDFSPRLAGRSIWIYMDNNCLSAVTRGDSDTDAIAILVGRLWATLQRNRFCAWLPRVPSKRNPADFSTRAKRSPCASRRKAPL